MIYILVIWTVVGVGAADRSPNIIKYDWRSLGEFRSEYDRIGPNVKTAEQMCHEAARQLGLQSKADSYRCVRSK